MAILHGKRDTFSFLQLLCDLMLQGYGSSQKKKETPEQQVSSTS